MQGTNEFEVTSFLGTWNEKTFFKVQCKESLEFFTMEVVSKQSFMDAGGTEFGTAAESLPNWGLPFCMELRFVFETQTKRYYVLDPAGEANLANLMMDGLPEPTVIIIAAELALALEGLHELGVSYNELDLDHVTVDNEGHVVLWREFEGKEYWHISECICGILDGNCEKIGHKVKRRGTNLPPGQRHWEEILLGAQDDWKSLGILLCQLLTGQVDFLNFQSFERAIITLFITPTTKDFLYSLISGALQSFEDLKCHPCFDGLDWVEVKSKSFPSPLMASFRSRLHSAPSRSFSKSPSLQNVYTASISARQERGVFAHSPLSRTRSTSELHANSSGRARSSFSAFNRSASERRNTLCVPYSGSGQSRPNKETSMMMLRTGNTNKQDGRNFGVSHVGQKSHVRLHRQVFGRNSQNFDRPQCVSAPSSPRQSVDSGLNYVYPPPNSAPSSPRGSDGALNSDNGPGAQSPSNNGVFFNHPETNPFHEVYQKHWGSASIDTAYGIYSTHLNPTGDDNNNTTAPGNSRGMASTNQLKSNSVYDNYPGDLNAYGSTSGYRHSVSSEPSTSATVYSPVLNQNGAGIIPERAVLLTNSDQISTRATEVTQSRRRSGHYSVDGSLNNNMMYNYSPRNSPKNPTRPYDSPVIVVPRQSEEELNNVNTSGIYVPDSQLSPGNMNSGERNFQNISDQHREHFPHHRLGTTSIHATNGIESLRTRNANHIPSGHFNGSCEPPNPFNPPNDEQFQKRRECANPENESFFQTSLNGQNVSMEQSTPKETANLLFQKYFRSRRASADSQASGKISPNSGLTENNLARDCSDVPQQVPRQAHDVARTRSQFRQNIREIPTTNLRNLPSEQLANKYFEREPQTLPGQRAVEECSDLRNSPRDEDRNDLNESIHLQGTANNFTQEQIQETSIGRGTSFSSVTTTNSLTPPSTTFQKRNSRSPEPVVAIHPFVNLTNTSAPDTSELSVLLSSDADEYNRFQEQSQRRRSSSDVASLSSLPVSTSKSENLSLKPSLSRSRSYSNMSKSFGTTKNDRTNAGQANNRRSTALRPIPSFEEFRKMRALSKTADDDNSTGKGENSEEKSERKSDYQSKRDQNSGNNSNSNNLAQTTTTSNTNNIVIQDLLAKYGLDKNPRTSTVKPRQNASNRSDNRDSSSPVPPNDTLQTTTPDSTDTKQRLLNILDDFLAVRTKQKTLSTSRSMYELKTVNSSSHPRRPSLREENLSNSSQDCSGLVCKSTDLNLTVKSPNRSDSESSFTSEFADSKPESPNWVDSSPNSKSYENMKCKQSNCSDQSKIQNNSNRNDRKTCSERSRRKSKRTNPKQGSVSEVKKSDSLAALRAETKAEVSVEKLNNDIHQSDESVVTSTADVNTRKREESRRVSEEARNVARKHKESLELVKISGKKSRKERRRSFTQAMQSNNKESTSEQDECIGQGNGEKHPVGKCAPVKGDHSVEVVSEAAEPRDMKYLRLKHRRTSSLLSLTDETSGNLDEFDAEDSSPARCESLTEFKESNSDQEISRGDSFLSVETECHRRSRASRTESNSSALSRCSSFHSNFSADSGSVQLDFEESDDDDDLFYLAEPRETDQKSETEIQRNDSGLGDEIGVGTRTKKRWQDLGRVTSRQSMVVASWRELGAKKDERVEEEQGIVKEVEVEEAQQKQERKVSRDRRISRERQPNAIDCPDCGRAFVVESDKPSVKSQGPKETLICYKCQSHRVERKEAIVELVQTEMNYGNDFQIIKEEFLSPMQTAGIISPDNLAKIFLNIQELLDVSTKFCKKIQSSMEECADKNDEELCHMNIGKIFVENVELLQAYELYCTRQPEAMTLLENLQKKNEVLRVFLNITCRENPKCRKMDINSFLMAPVQRVTKYPLLLSRIRRATPRWHDDREDLKSAQRKVEEQIAKINSLTKSSEMKAKKFQSNLGASDSVDSSRLKKLASDVLAWTLDEMQLLMHGQLKVLCSEFGGGQSWTKRATKRSIETHLLFCIRGQNEPIKVDSEEDDDRLHFPDASEISDASLLLLKRKSNGKYTLFRDEVRLRDCVVYRETEPDAFGLIHMGKESFQFTARTSKDARKWFKYLKLQTKGQGKWRRRRNASANIMLKTS